MVKIQTNIRLDDDIIIQLKERSRQQNTSLSALINQILRNELEVTDRDTFGSATLVVKLDNLLATLCRIDRKIRISKEQKYDPH